jgi:hypothetical protein
LQDIRNLCRIRRFRRKTLLAEEVHDATKKEQACVDAGESVSQQCLDLLMFGKP